MQITPPVRAGRVGRARHDEGKQERGDTQHGRTICAAAEGPDLRQRKAGVSARPLDRADAPKTDLLNPIPLSRHEVALPQVGRCASICLHIQYAELVGPIETRE